LGALSPEWLDGGEVRAGAAAARTNVEKVSDPEHALTASPGGDAIASDWSGAGNHT
jgi:hypothetical protein